MYWKYGAGCLLAAVVLAGALPASAAESVCAVRSGAKTVPLVELYTSEGCSSCPPADRWLSQNAGQNDANWLAFHVDYWDEIGWSDPFGSPAWSQRQRQRVGAQGGNTVYTPQVMVGSQVQAEWRSAAQFDRLQRPAQAPGAGLALHLQAMGGGWQASVGASRVAGENGDGAQLWLAQYLDGQTSTVRAGENEGLTLRHDRVVRRLWGPWPLGNTPLAQSIDVPAQSGNWGLVAFVQDQSGHTLQSLGLAAAGCGQ